jgi:hypothetical protein
MDLIVKKQKKILIYVKIVEIQTKIILRKNLKASAKNTIANIINKVENLKKNFEFKVQYFNFEKFRQNSETKSRGHLTQLLVYR